MEYGDLHAQAVSYVNGIIQNKYSDSAPERKMMMSECYIYDVKLIREPSLRRMKMTDIKMGYMDKHNGEARTFVLRVREDGSIYIIGQKTIEGSVCACQLAHYAEGSLVFLGVEEDE